MNVADAITHGARQRLRPILMTALATVFALTPMALGLTGGGGFISQPLAIVVIGGLVSSTALTLILVPVLYRLVEGRRERRPAAQDPQEAVRRGTAPSAGPRCRRRVPRGSRAGRADCGRRSRRARRLRFGQFCLAGLDHGGHPQGPRTARRQRTLGPLPAPQAPDPQVHAPGSVRPRPWAPTREGSLSCRLGVPESADSDPSRARTPRKPSPWAAWGRRPASAQNTVRRRPPGR